MDEKILKTMRKIVDYLMPDELRHYKECDKEGQKNHIYKDLVKIDEYLNKEGVKEWS